MPLAAQGQRDERDGGWGGIHAGVSPWSQTGSPKIRGVINLSVELANPIAPWPGNLAFSGGGRAEARRGREKREREGGGDKIHFIKSHLSFNKPWCWTGDEA